MEHLKVIHKDLQVDQNRMRMEILGESEQLRSEKGDEEGQDAISDSVCENVDGDNVRESGFIAAGSEENQEILGNDKECAYCQQCGISSTMENLLSHANIVHGHKTPFHCQHCDFATQKRNNFLNHVKIIHYKMREKRCPHCNFTTDRQYRLNKHVEQLHTYLGVKEDNTGLSLSGCVSSNSLDEKTTDTENLTSPVTISCQKDSAKFINEASSSSDTLDLVDLTNDKFTIINKRITYCQHCSKSNSMVNILWHVNIISDAAKKFHCRHCNVSFTRKVNLLRHVKVVHYKMKEKCPHCNFTSAWKNSIRGHIQSRHGKSGVTKSDLGKIVWVQISDVGKKVNENMRNPQSEISQEIDHPTKPSHGQHVHKSNTWVNVLSHANIIRDPEISFHCQHCDYTTQRRGNFIQHVKTVHFKMRVKMLCSHCNYTTDRKNYLIKHIMKVHKTVIVQNNNRDQILLYHLTTSSFFQEAAVTENLTNSDIVNEATIRDTLNIVDLTNDECAIVKPKITYCQHCSKSNSRSNLLWHINIVSQEVIKFHCRHCNISCTRKVDLLKHVKVVHYNMRDKCPHCSYMSGWKGDMKKHIQRKHNKLRVQPAELEKIQDILGTDSHHQAMNGSASVGNFVTLYFQEDPAESKDMNSAKEVFDIVAPNCQDLDEKKVTILQQYKCIWCSSSNNSSDSNLSKEEMKTHLQENHCLTLEEYLQMNEVSFT